MLNVWYELEYNSRCADWSESLLVAHSVLQVYLCPGSSYCFAVAGYPTRMSTWPDSVVQSMKSYLHWALDPCLVYHKTLIVDPMWLIYCCTVAGYPTRMSAWPDSGPEHEVLPPLVPLLGPGPLSSVPQGSDCRPNVASPTTDGKQSRANLVLIAYANSKGSGEPAHPRSLARTSAARSYKHWVKRNLQTESQIPSPSEWLGMHSYNLSWRNARRHKFAWRGSVVKYWDT